MKINEIKNKIALTEVCKNYGYKVNIEENNISIESETNKLAYVKEGKDNKMVITVLGQEVSRAEAIELLKNIDKAIDLLDYLDESMK